MQPHHKAKFEKNLSVDLGYGIEGHSPEIYFEVGLTDF